MEQSKARIVLDKECDAGELEELIRNLALARAAMSPAVPDEPPIDGDALVEENALFRIRTLANGGLRVYLRSEGIGWIAFSVDAEARERLADFLGKKVGHTHTSH